MLHPYAWATWGMGDIILSHEHRCWSIMDSLMCYGVWSLPLPSAIHCLTATTPALTVTLSANVDGSALGASGVNVRSARYLVDL